MKILWILAWTCWPESVYPGITYEVWESSHSALRAITNGNHGNCDWQIFETTGTKMMGSK